MVRSKREWDAVASFCEAVCSRRRRRSVREFAPLIPATVLDQVDTTGLPATVGVGLWAVSSGGSSLMSIFRQQTHVGGMRCFTRSSKRCQQPQRAQQGKGLPGLRDCSKELPRPGT
ncbi:hypothetical protein B5X24_HaOG205627 [Helicoverpa armigera]|uniref:Uncharacterized protein n=1 Tax=Helicoverpa armigera TaxID=29058 RepID=A0A2W1BRN1_HELAM|nr:hypothetical protein B5X24_HaOG205627 [Helicoverpa armigera]